MPESERSFSIDGFPYNSCYRLLSLQASSHNFNEIPHKRKHKHKQTNKISTRLQIIPDKNEKHNQGNRIIPENRQTHQHRSKTNDDLKYKNTKIQKYKNTKTNDSPSMDISWL